MFDMLVRLYALPDSAPTFQSMKEQGITIRRCNPFEAHILEDWIATHFSPRWVCESRVAMGRQPSGCIIATRDGQILGFACCDATARGFFGPMGVHPELRGTGVGKALLFAGMEQMKSMGYAYAVIGGVGPADFYAKCAGATPIENSSPGIYADILPSPPSFNK